MICSVGEQKLLLDEPPVKAHCSRHGGDSSHLSFLHNCALARPVPVLLCSKLSVLALPACRFPAAWWLHIRRQLTISSLKSTHAGRKPPVESAALVSAAAHLNDTTRSAKRAQRDCSDLYLLLSLHRYAGHRSSERIKRLLPTEAGVDPCVNS